MLQAAARGQNPGDENRALVSHPQSPPGYLPSDLRSTLSSRESTVLIVLRRCVIEICHTVTTVRLDGKEVLVESNGTKTKSSKRTLPLVPVFRERLLALQEEQKENRKLCGRCYNKKYANYICVDAMGNLLKPDYLSNSFQIILQNYHLRRIRFHDLRHSCASLLLANGVPMKMIQEWLGHSDFSTTANIYSHLDYASKVSSAEAMLNGLGMGSNPQNDT